MGVAMNPDAHAPHASQFCKRDPSIGTDHAPAAQHVDRIACPFAVIPGTH